MIEFKLTQILRAASTLFHDITLAKNLFVEKHAVFKTLCAIYAGSVSEWNKLDRSARAISADKEVRCVYRQYSKKGLYWFFKILSHRISADYFISVPSRSRIYQALLAELEAEPDKTPNENLTPTTPSFLNEAILIIEEQSVGSFYLLVQLTQNQLSDERSSGELRPSERHCLMAWLMWHFQMRLRSGVIDYELGLTTGAIFRGISCHKLVTS